LWLMGRAFHVLPAAVDKMVFGALMFCFVGAVVADLVRIGKEAK
jgi:hypothetical protein